MKENGPTKDFHRFCCCMARRVGNMFVLCERHDGSPIVIAGPCWPFCFLVTLPLILGIPGTVAYFVIISNNSPLVSTIRFVVGDCAFCGRCSYQRRLSFHVLAYLGRLYLLSSPRLCSCFLILCQLSGSRSHGTGDRRRGRRGRLVLERASGKFPPTGSFVLSRVWSADSRL